MNIFDAILLDFQQQPDKYVYPFVIHEKKRDRLIITYNEADDFGKKLRKEHDRLAKSFEENFCDRNNHSFAYHKNISCADALVQHLKSNYFIKLDIHHFFESITEELFFDTYKNVFNSYWKQKLKGCFYQGHLSIGFITSPIISDYFMKNFDEVIEDYLSDKPGIHYSRYSDDILLSSETNEEQLNELYEVVKKELKKLSLSINEKKTKNVTLSLTSHNSLTFLGLNLSKLDDVNNKVTISKAYILFLLKLIKKNELYQNKCKGLIDEINSRVAYLAYNSPISYQRFQNKHLNIFGKPYNFVVNEAKVRFSGNKTDDIDNYYEYLEDYQFDIHKKIVNQTTGQIISFDGVEIKKYIGDKKEVIIPDFVVGIGNRAFEGSKVKKVVLNEHIKSISENSFNNCVNLEEVNLPDKLVYLGEYAFNKCEKLKSITIGSRLKNIYPYTFFGCHDLKEINIGKNVQSIGNSALAGCESLEKIIIPENVENIEGNVFDNDYYLKEVKILGQVKSLKANTFNNCLLLEKISLPDSVLNIEKQVFRNCLNLESLVLPSQLVNIDSSAFENCQKLNDISIDKDNRVYYFDEKSKSLIDKQNKKTVFASSTHSLVLEDRKILTKEDFKNFKEEHYTIDNNIEIIEAEAFKDCLYLQNIIIPDSVKQIGADAFNGCINLKKVVFNGSLRVLPNGCFKNCSQLEQIKLPSGLLEISDYAFANCKNLKEIDLTGIKKVGYKAFGSCSGLNKLVIPKTLTSIKPYGFFGCQNLEEIIVDKDNVVYDSRDSSNCLIKTKYNEVVLGCKNSKLINGLLTVGEGAFACNHQLDKLIIPTSLNRIKKFAFYECISLKEVDLNNVVFLGEASFGKCNKLENCHMHNCLTTIEQLAFEDCTSLKEINLPSSLSTLAANCFNGCNNVKKLNIGDSNIKLTVDHFISLTKLDEITVSKHNPIYNSGNDDNILVDTKAQRLIKGCKNSRINDTIETIGTRSFMNNDELVNIEIAETVTAIEKDSFKNCSNLETVIIHEGLSNICDSAFALCKKLKSIELPTSLRLIGENAFNGCSFKEITLNEHISSLKLGILSNNMYLETINIEGKIDNFNNGFALNTPKLKNINITNNTDFTFKSGSLISGKRLLWAIDTYIPNDVEKIESYCFAFNDKIEEIEIPQSVTDIGDYCFLECHNLRKVSLPDQLKTLGKSTFYNCDNLEEVYLPDTLQTIYQHAFKGCEKLTEVTLPKDLKCIYDGAFEDVNLKRLVLNADIQLVGNPFINCGKSLEYIEDENSKEYCENGIVRDNCLIVGCKNTILKEHISTIGEACFKGSDIVNIDLEKVDNIYHDSFENCSRLQKVTIHNHLNIVNDYLRLSENTNLIVEEGHPFYYPTHDMLISKMDNCLVYSNNKANIPDYVKAIGGNCFTNNGLVKNLHIPANVTSINIKGLDGLNLETIDVDENNPIYVAKNNGLIVSSANSLIKAGKNTIINEGIKAIKGNCFTGNTVIETVTIVSSVKQININAFNGCTSLKEIIVSKDNPIYESSDDHLQLISKQTGKVIIDLKHQQPKEKYIYINTEDICINNDTSFDAENDFSMAF